MNDPRYCPQAVAGEPHEGHDYRYKYQRVTGLGGHTTGVYYCDGVTAPVTPQGDSEYLRDPWNEARTEWLDQLITAHGPGQCVPIAQVKAVLQKVIDAADALDRQLIERQTVGLLPQREALRTATAAAVAAIKTEV